MIGNRAEGEPNERAAPARPEGAPLTHKGWPRGVTVAAAALVLLVLGGCVAMSVETPHYPATDELVRSELERMEREPTPLERPVVVLGGYRTPGWSAQNMAGRIRRVTGAKKEQTLAVSFALAWDLESMAETAVERVEERWPSDDPERTVEVDVVGISMGGLIARLAALPPEMRGIESGGKRLRIARLFTLGTPHRGATLARLVALDGAARSMKPGSELLERLNAEHERAAYELVCYARLNDRWVGARNSAPPGVNPIWVPGPLLLSHQTITTDRRILADLGRRLRGEEPLARCGEAPPSD